MLLCYLLNNANTDVAMNAKIKTSGATDGTIVGAKQAIATPIHIPAMAIPLPIVMDFLL